MTEAEILDKARSILKARRLARGRHISQSSVACDHLKFVLAPFKQEVFGCLYLCAQHRILAWREHFFGSIDGCSVHPRVIVAAALELHAAAVIFGHNHPSGVSEPSRADRAMTNRLRDALALIDVRVIDHVVVGDDTATSFTERGWL